MRRTSPLIVGGGPAGASAAIALAQMGMRPLVIERSSAPRDIVCGGFMGSDALGSLGALGIDAAGLGAHPIGRLRLAAGSRTAEFDLPFAAVGLSRRALDAALLAQAERCGAGLERGLAVRAIEGDVARTDGGEVISEAILLATGKHELRGHARPMPRDPAVGLRLSLAPTPGLAASLAGTVELILFERGWAGLLIQEDGAINLCLSISGSRLAEAGSPDALLAQLAHEAPLLGARLDAAGDLGPIGSVARVPYGYVAPPGRSHLWRLGDQASVIPSFAGDGVALAMASGRMAARHLAAGGSAADYQQSWARAAGRTVRLSNLAARLNESATISRSIPSLMARLPMLMRWIAIATRSKGY
jgi:flavin-dependent dehydrogenase